MSETSIMIVTGEASGDMHGANLIRAMKEIEPGLSVCGMGGKDLLAQGIETLYDASKLAVVGLFEVFAHLSDIRAALKTLEKRLEDKPPDLLILIDYPDFNLLLAKKARRLKIPIFYYISPQVWAWRSGRVKKIGRLVDGMAVILPFERDFYRQRGVSVDFVGHPLLDSVEVTKDRAAFLAEHIIPPDKRVIGILPGSRKKEVSAMLPIFLAAAERLVAKHHNLVFLLPQASTIKKADLEKSGLADCGLDIRVVSGNRYNLMAACDAVMAASGTVTLELAILGVPMLVAYRVSPMTYRLGRWLIKVKYASLVNLVAGKKVVSEFMQDEATPEKIYHELDRLLADREGVAEMRQQLAEVCSLLGEPGVSARVARLALGLVRTPV
ncbi:MAG: lipid-A-disaccharide synthase [Proteobacteria bacterium]|nr:lipid-A-disaccharide synthase [Pseudomonadota bacterium]MBU1714060.1 lipid-A-disaccharide synthase [Pseudomonadota bacterium]